MTDLHAEIATLAAEENYRDEYGLPDSGTFDDIATAILADPRFTVVPLCEGEKRDDGAIVYRFSDDYVPVILKDGVIRLGNSWYWNVDQGDDPTALVGAILGAYDETWDDREASE